MFLQNPTQLTEILKAMDNVLFFGTSAAEEGFNAFIVTADGQFHQLHIPLEFALNQLPIQRVQANLLDNKIFVEKACLLTLEKLCSTQALSVYF